MNRDDIRDVLKTGTQLLRNKQDFYNKNFGSMFGWITQPDQAFLCDFLPPLALQADAQLKVVEIGTFAGSTARGLITLTGGGSITCVDDFYEFKYYEGRLEKNVKLLGGHDSGPDYFWSTLKQFPDLSEFSTLIEGHSADVGSTWVDPIDILFIDGDHSYEAALKDCQLYSPHVVKGGYCMVDDYQMTEVTKAVDEYFADETVWEKIRVPDKNPASIIVFKRK